MPNLSLPGTVLGGAWKGMIVLRPFDFRDLDTLAVRKALAPV